MRAHPKRINDSNPLIQGVLMRKTVYLLWIDHYDSHELVGVYTEKKLAKQDEARLGPKTVINERILNEGQSLFLEAPPKKDKT